MNESRAGAIALRDLGWTYREIADLFGVAKGTAYRWMNADYEQHELAVSRAWKDRNRDRTRAYDREHAHKPCPVCGEDMARTSDRCAGCVLAVAAVRRSLAEGMWADGWSLREMAEAFGVTQAYFTVRRAQNGWDLPHRYRVRNGRRVAA